MGVIPVDLTSELYMLKLLRFSLVCYKNIKFVTRDIITDDKIFVKFWDFGRYLAMTAQLMNRVELSLHAFGLLNAGIHGIHDSGAHAFFLQYLDCLDRGSTGGAHHVLQFSGMSAGLQHHPGTAKDGL